MNERDTRLSVALDALTELQESMDQHHGHAVGVVLISRWEDLTATVRECIEDVTTAPDTKTHVLRRTDEPRASQGHLEIA